MQLSQYDRVVCLCVDKRFVAESGRVKSLLVEHGVQEQRLQFFIDGDGVSLPREAYDQLLTGVPRWWTHGRGAYAHFCAMRTVVDRARKDGVENLLWVEDDVVFADNFDDVVAAATTQLRGLPPWAVLYYGANHTWATTDELSPNVLQCHGSYTTHCMGIHASVMTDIVRLPERHVIDNVIANTLHHAKRCYAVWPNVALQKPGFSHISLCEMNYDHYFKNKGTNWI